MADRTEFEQKCGIIITISVDVGDERICNEMTVTGTAENIGMAVDDAIADLGLLERSSIPAAVEQQWQDILDDEETAAEIAALDAEEAKS